MSSQNQLITWLVTGASRGIGLELVKEILQSPDNLVIAACRSPEKATALHLMQSSHQGRLHLLQLDVTDFDAVRAASKDIAAILGDSGLDYLFNNAGIIPAWDTAFTLVPEDALAALRTNTLGPVLVAQACLPFLEKGQRKTIVNISSTEGSIQTIKTNGQKLASYACSKAALNMLTLKMSAERPDLIAVCICPGWVKTDLGGDGAEIEASESVPGILKMAAAFTIADSGRYIRYNEETIPW